MKFESFEEIMEYAIGKEKEAARFYEEASQREKFSGVKEVFQSFAAEERKHQAMLKGFSQENIDHYTVEKIPDLKRSDYLVDLEYEPGMTYEDILKLAMKREEKAFKFYSDFSRQATLQEHKKLFDILAQEESKHKLKLETIYDDHMAEMGD
ncbi:MAG: ferritin family protein [Deltaproteobacteria bacterium]|nr:ferritin family protein [Deltaproteobacteria bacterium]